MRPLAAKLLLGSALALLAPGWGAAAPAPASRPRVVASSPDGTRKAEVRRRPAGGEALFVDGRMYWPEPGARTAAQVTTGVVWSRRGDAVALVARESRSGKTTLVVALVDGDAAPTALSWDIPQAAQPARAIMWLGPTRVAVGPREMEPKVVASWTSAAAEPAP